MTEKLVLNIDEAAALLGLTRKQLYEVTRDRSRARQTVPIPFLRLGKRIAFRREALEEWIRASEKANAVLRNTR